MSVGLKNLTAVVVIALLAIGGSYAYRWNDSRLSKLSEASLDWPSVSGLIVHSELEVERSSLRNSYIDHHIRVIFEYVVGDQSYRNDTIRFDQANLSVTNKEALVSSHPAGRTVTVFYNPDNPKQSVLVQGSY